MTDTCHRHPKYKGLRQPRTVTCPFCWALYMQRQPGIITELYIGRTLYMALAQLERLEKLSGAYTK